MRPAGSGSTSEGRPNIGAGPAPAAGRIPFEPALEGLRGFALLGMLCFHSRFSWAVGGFLPIATFFTLSGYLITSLFLTEWERTGRIRLGAFWARRLRRLMPASLFTLAGMSLFAAFVATPEQLARLRDDVTWALFYLANWHFVWSNAAYQHLFEAPSPVQHFWSLAIEEQFYFAFPLVAVLGLRVGRGSRLALGGLFAALTAASVLVSVWLMESGASIDRVYYGSDSRAAELLLGGLLAVALRGRQELGGLARRFAGIAGAAAMCGMLWLWHGVHLTERWLYYGGFAAYTLLTVAVIVAGVQPTGFVRWLLARDGIRWIGRVSYGAYLFHWPIFLWLSAERTGLDPASLFAVRVVVTFSLAGLSYRFIESPIRSGRALTGWRPLVMSVRRRRRGDLRLDRDGALDRSRRLEVRRARSRPVPRRLRGPSGRSRRGARARKERAAHRDLRRLDGALARHWTRRLDAGDGARATTARALRVRLRARSRRDVSNDGRRDGPSEPVRRSRRRLAREAREGKTRHRHRDDRRLGRLRSATSGRRRLPEPRRDLAGLMRAHPGGEMDPAYRPDGTHFTVEAGVKLAKEWLGFEVLREYREQSNQASAKEAAAPPRT